MSSARLLLLSLFCTVLTAETLHRKSNLSGQLADVVPACAEDCFLSFLDANYGLARGQEIPSLEDLCSTDGDTGFTVGEGAVQCIAAEQRVGACSGKDADSSVMYKAYRMCSDQPGALTPTHGVITATLVVPPSGGGPISYPAPSKTRTRSFVRSRLPSTLVIDTHSPTFTPSSSSDTTLRTAVVSTTTAETTAETTATSSSTSEPAAAAAAAPGGSITPVQKAGIAVGVIGFAAVAIGLLLLFRLYKARKKRGRHSPLGTSPRRRDSWGYKFDKSHRGSSSEPSWIANTVHLPTDSNNGPSAATMTGAVAVGGGREAGRRTQAPSPQPQPQPQTFAPKPPPPRAYNRSSWRPSLIGLALSPSHAKHTGQITPTPSRPVSKLLPAKPILSLYIPKKPPTPPAKHTPPPPGPSARNQPETTPSPEYNRIASQPPVLPKLQIPQGHHDFLHVSKSTNKSRESTMTEFEEDGRDSSTVFSPGNQTWSAPSAAPPSSVATYHMADARGNWRPGDSNIVQAAELEGTTPMSAYPKLATSTIAVPVGAKGRGEESGWGAAKRPAHRRSSSAPMPPNAAHKSIRMVTEPVATPSYGQDNVVPRPLFSDMGGNSRSARHSFGRSLTRPRAASGDSGITNISVSSDEEHELQPPGKVSQANLSPVTESPRSGSGKSPLSYPKIPGRDNGPKAKDSKETGAQPPRMPVLYKSAHHRTAAGGIGSSLAMVTVGSLAPNLNANASKETNHAASSATAMAAPAASSVSKPIGPATRLTTASPHPDMSASRGPRPMQNPALLRTGSPTMRSPTMRIVEPSPEPDDDRAMLPSARPRSVQQPLPQRQQTQLQPSPLVAAQTQASSQHMAHLHPPQHPPHHHQQAHPPFQPFHPCPPAQPQNAPRPHAPAPNWIPGLPAHPHPLRRPRHTSTLWLPPQARKRTSHPRKKRKTMETEPDHHAQSPLRPLRQPPSLHAAPFQPPRPQPPPPPPPPPHDPHDQQPVQQMYMHRSNPHDPPSFHPVHPVHPVHPDYPDHHAHQQHSIVAKRLGHHRAVNMSISTDCTSASSSNHRRRASGGPVHPSPEIITPGQHSGDLPSTPTWLPRLTPTRRGTDLYLNVQ